MLTIQITKSLYWRYWIKFCIYLAIFKNIWKFMAVYFKHYWIYSKIYDSGFPCLWLNIRSIQKSKNELIFEYIFVTSYGNFLILIVFFLICIEMNFHSPMLCDYVILWRYVLLRIRKMHFSKGVQRHLMASVWTNCTQTFVFNWKKIFEILL